MEFEPPVFVVGSGRSGTTLLYSILLSSGAFAVYQAETLLLEVCRPKYGSLHSYENFTRFITDWVNSKQFHRSGLEAGPFVEEAQEHRRDYFEFMRFFMESIARKQGKIRWAEQTPGHVFNIGELSRAFEDAKFIHVVRDGRDVALSRRKLGWTGSNSRDELLQLICASKSWENPVLAGKGFASTLGDNYLELRYEDIVTDLNTVLSRISVFLGIRITEEDVGRSLIGSLGKANTAFGSKMPGISSRRKGRWKNELSQFERGVLQQSIGKTLTLLGYEGDSDVIGKINVPISASMYIRLFPRFLEFRRILRERTWLGRLTQSELELGLR